MTGATHTPGPWFCEYGADGYYGLCHNGDEALDSNIAENERLIAAAPELLEALRQLLGNAIVARHHLAVTEDASLIGSALWDTIGQAERAISKATGAPT
jgi:hypothetical protein